MPLQIVTAYLIISESIYFRFYSHVDSCGVWSPELSSTYLGVLLCAKYAFIDPFFDGYAQTTALHHISSGLPLTLSIIFFGEICST